MPQPERETKSFTISVKDAEKGTVEAVCACGCGERPPLASRTWPERGWVKGQPIRYVHGHHMRGRSRPDSRMRFKAGQNPRWANGVARHSAGYVWVRVPDDHPMADVRGYCLEHRLVMAESLGRPLFSREVVHHRNGIKSDNRLENLEVFDSQRAHARHHAESAR